MYMFGPLATCLLGALAWALLLRYGLPHLLDPTAAQLDVLRTLAHR